MLDVETKRRIDTARDILVGKVPDPKSQVEQITIALIYKFMDDMDAEAEELGGERTFFKGKFERYGWTKLMAPNMGGFDVISLYSESIQKMNENPNIPQLFRDIFKNAYLPYRDPETLKSFLKIINGFSYDHSERLGDAFEYLLSVLGSQGEAGQFRTPRHIIDFMVEVIEPKKNESILDPACGTAGFLISSYKHIRKHNSSNFKPEADREAFDEKGVNIEELTLDSPKNYRGDLLMLDDRARLSGNIRGLDISPDMVRLSLVNMYLHGFTEPHIYEYDTLTSEERWNEFYDIILANPPFMSPKGGIKPHKRFSVQSNRSEVLFVDYIAEHITPTGRAAVIVPEGIIFQSGTAYKQLRKMLVGNYLFAVVSLPAGVFNPYSGVKTSILFMDKPLAKKTDKILFVKIESDGFGLGAQRRPIDRNDLPEALKAIRDYRAKVANGEVFEVEKWANVLVVEKDKIAGNGEYYLSGERYKTDELKVCNYESVTLGNEDIFQIESGGTPSSEVEEYWKGAIRWATLVDLPQENFITEIYDTQRKITEAGLAKSSAKLIPKDSVIVSTRATIGRIAINRVELATNQGFKNIIIKDKSKVCPEYIAYVLTNQVEKMQSMASGGTFKELSKSSFCTLKIPLPPLEVQKEIVAEIEGYQKIIDGGRQVVQNYKPQIQIDPKWEMVELGKLTLHPIRSGAAITKQDIVEIGDFKFVNIKDLYYTNGINVENLPSVKTKDIKSCILRKGDVLFVRVSLKEEGVGYSAIFYSDKSNVVYGDNIFRVSPDLNRVNPWYLHYLLRTDRLREQIINKSMRANVTSINQTSLKSLEIPLPDLETQHQIVARIEKEQELVNANKELIRIFEQKIKDRIAAVWGE